MDLTEKHKKYDKLKNQKSHSQTKKSSETKTNILSDSTTASPTEISKIPKKNGDEFLTYVHVSNQKKESERKKKKNTV
jgi:hypothetical protein